MQLHSLDLDTAIVCFLMNILFCLFVFSPEYDDGNADHLNGEATMIPLNSSTPQNKQEEAEALNGVLINEPELTDDGMHMNRNGMYG